MRLKKLLGSRLRSKALPKNILTSGDLKMELKVYNEECFILFNTKHINVRNAHLAQTIMNEFRIEI